jgi:hypothetical protein
MDRSATGVTVARAHDPAYQGYQILHWAFILVPTIAGLDKFFHLLTNWDKYLAPSVRRLLPISGHGFMLLVGVIELVAAAIVAIAPRVGAYIVACWLGAIILNLLMVGGMLDVAARDFGLLLGALALGRLSATYARFA